jgi:two-component system, OmpR family, osmolarity sensor histidine kinase EnvZ
MNRIPRTFTLVLVLVALALLLALSLSGVLSTRLMRHITTETYGRLAASSALAADALSTRDDATSQHALAVLRNIGVRFSDVPPPPAGTTTPVVAGIGTVIGRLIGDPARVTARQAPAQFWIRSAHAAQRWIVLQAPDYRQQVLDSTLLIAILAGLIALAVAAIAARLLTRPLENLAADAPALLNGDSRPEQSRGTTREVRHLAQAIAAAGARQRETARERELMLAGISHDLRTPLARLRIALELDDASDPQRREAMVADLQELDTALEQCLAFVRDGRDETPREIDLATLIGQLLALRAQPDDWQYDGPPSLSAMLRPSLMRRALGNLLDNAERYGAAPYTVALEHASRAIRVRVEDRGPGVPAELLPRLGRPFVRGDAARRGGGSGLGIGIAMRAAELHGGALRLRNRAGGGFSAELHLPFVPVILENKT